MNNKTSTIHNDPQFRELRKAFQGINATTKGSIGKSKRRHNARLKALEKYQN